MGNESVRADDSVIISIRHIIHPISFTMFGDIISINAVNVELTEEMRMIVMRMVLPLTRLMSSPQTPRFDVVLRQVRRPLSGRTYFVMIRVRTKDGSHYSIGTAHFFKRAVTEARDELRKTLSRTFTPDIKAIEQLRTKAHERYFVELFV